MSLMSTTDLSICVIMHRWSQCVRLRNDFVAWLRPCR